MARTLVKHQAELASLFTGPMNMNGRESNVLQRHAIGVLLTLRSDPFHSLELWSANVCCTGMFQCSGGLEAVLKDVQGKGSP